MKRLGILGSTGSIGRQTLDVLGAKPGAYSLVGISAKRASDELLKQAIAFKPQLVSCQEEPSKDWLNALPKGTDFIKGPEGIQEIVRLSDTIMNAISGIDGILPTAWTLGGGKTLLAANKESLVCLGDLVRDCRTQIIPVDSEHNAIYQLFKLINIEEVSKIYITASGGPLKDLPRNLFSQVSPQQAIAHPNWRMGPKISVDSATLMNKGMELIEAINLFNLQLDIIDVVIHPQSVVHAVLELKNGAFLFHVSQTDMRIPIFNALFDSGNEVFPFQTKSIIDISPITFEKLDEEKFPSVGLCKWVAKMGGFYPALLVGADQAAVELFLSGKITFDSIHRLIKEVLEGLIPPPVSTPEDIVYIVELAFQTCIQLSKKIS
ncbi:MAG: 1-deoxy-D-xylulose-5-phosphate reductoisomerase [Aquificaceae bacterium]|nr:1-deoxy-D-xylulose-5-phosphate reductoisomerase [Aquificaceae bacterium]MDW8237783.1 1-deoxy-D-xylulose-5-phosphate reductoisomerase [Aquificaceae bacterium]